VRFARAGGPEPQVRAGWFASGLWACRGLVLPGGPVLSPGFPFWQRGPRGLALFGFGGLCLTDTRGLFLAPGGYMESPISSPLVRVLGFQFPDHGFVALEDVVAVAG